jgi:hypothetical protein
MERRQDGGILVLLRQQPIAFRYAESRPGKKAEVRVWLHFIDPGGLGNQINGGLALEAVPDGRGPSLPGQHPFHSR